MGRANGQTGRRPRRRERWRASLAQRLRAYLFAGIIVAAPIGITALIVREVVRYFDTTVAAVIPARYNPETYMPFSLPGIGVVVVLGFLILVGWFAAGVVGRTAVRTGERLLDRTPVVRAIYGTLKQVFETLFTQSSRAFREVVLVEFPQPGTYALGFVTGTAGAEVQRAGQVGGAGDELANVLIPMSPFPSSGFLLFVPKERLVRLDMTVEEGMKMVLSGGIVGPPTREVGTDAAAEAPAPDPSGLARPPVLADQV